MMALMVIGCISKKQIHTSAEQTKEEKSTSEVASKEKSLIEGTIIDRTTIGGCFYQIETVDGKILTPVHDLDTMFHHDQMKVLFAYRPSRMMTTCMNGTPAVISIIKKVAIE